MADPFREQEALLFHLAGQDAIAKIAAEAKVEIPPFGTEEGARIRGYIDENGEPTEDGKLFIDLRDLGFFDETGNPTPKGRAFAMEPDEALKEVNRDAFIRRKMAGLDKTEDMTIGGAFKEVSGFIGDAFQGAGRAIDPKRNVRALWDDKIKAEQALGGMSFVEGAIEAPAQLGAGLMRLGDKMQFDPNDMEYWDGMQKFERNRRKMQDAELGDYVGGVMGSAEVIANAEKMMQQARGTLGPERAAEIETQGEAGGQLFGDPTNYLTAGVGAAVGGAKKLPFLARMGSKVDDAAQAGFRAEEAASAVQAATLRARQAFATQRQAEQQALRLQGVDAVKAAEWQATAQAAAREAATLDAALPGLQATAADTMQQAAKLGEAAGGAQKVLGMVEQAAEIGRQVRSAPLRALGPLMEKTADNLGKMNGPVGAFLKKTSGLGALGAASGMLPPWMAAGAAALVAKPALRQLGAFTRVLGDELLQARGTVPFWRSVAENSATTPIGRALAHGMDFLTLGGRVPEVAGRVAKGTAAAAPLNIGFEAVAAGGEFSPSTMNRGLAEALLFAGGPALGGAIVRGRKRDFLARSAGDEVLLRQKLSPEETARFSRMPKGDRQAAATMAASFPALRIEYVEDGPGSFNHGTNTARINVRERNPLRPLVAHEVNHFIEAEGQIGEGVRSMLVGENGIGGMLRDRNGALDKNFREFADAYNARMAREGLPPLDVEEVAMEYFNEATVDYLLADLDSGRLQAQRVKPVVKSAIDSAVKALIPKLPILKNLFLRSGGALDGSGKMVPGNRLIPEVRSFPSFQEMMRRGYEQAMQAQRRDAGAPPVIDTTNLRDNPAVRDTLFSELETDAGGVVITDARGNAKPVPIEAQERKAVETAQAAREVIDAEIIHEAEAAAGRQTPDPEPLDLADPEIQEEVTSETPEQVATRAKPAARGEYRGTHFSPRTLLRLRKVLNKPQHAVLRMWNRAARDWSGEVFHTLYNPATKRKNGQPVYATRGMEQYKVAPFAVKINKAGGVFVELLNITKLNKNLSHQASTAKGQRLYGGNENAIRADLEAVVQLHRQHPSPTEANRITDAYFQQKYGQQWKEYQNFVNTVFGNLGVKAQQTANPTIATEMAKDTSTIESFRIDRVNQTTRLTGETPVPVNYTAVKLNLLPRGIPTPKEK